MTTTETPQATTVPTTSTTSTTLQPDTNCLLPLDLSISTHNVQGLNNNTKKETWEYYCFSHNLDIISISETKLSSNPVGYRPNKTKHFTYFWSCTDSAKASTVIMICNTLIPHIHKVYNNTTSLGYAIAIDLFFKHDFKFWIISVYLPCSEQQLRLQVQDTVIQWIQQAISNNILPIILGDFNTTTENTLTSNSKYKLLQFLTYNNFIDLSTHTQSLASTWRRAAQHSQIDYIWAYSPLISYLLGFNLDDPKTSTLSDHKILTSQWSFPYAYIGQPKHKSKSRRRIFNYKLMDTEKWQNFADQIMTNLRQNRAPIETQTTETLENTWHKIQLSITCAAMQWIPNKRTTMRNFYH